MKTLRFIYSNGLSDCHKTKALLVRSREGGFVTRNCLRCGKPGYVGPHHLPNLECEFCGGPLVVKLLDKNYCYICGKCDRQWELPSLLPHWTELFQYSGLLAPGEGSFT